jgi:hypothetical protein
VSVVITLCESRREQQRNTFPGVSAMEGVKILRMQYRGNRRLSVLGTRAQLNTGQEKVARPR